jgi:hypothetical protein
VYELGEVESFTPPYFHHRWVRGCPSLSYPRRGYERELFHLIHLSQLSSFPIPTWSSFAGKVGKKVDQLDKLGLGGEVDRKRTTRWSKRPYMGKRAGLGKPVMVG